MKTPSPRGVRRKPPGRARACAALLAALALGATAPLLADGDDTGEAAIEAGAEPGPEPAAPDGDGASPEGAAEASAAADAEADGEPSDGGHDYPTVAIADYVLGCMVANGNTYQALQQCSCSIDFIKARMDYKTYEQAGTILQVQRDTGQRGIFYRDSNWAKRKVEALEALQAESTLRCF